MIPFDALARRRMTSAAVDRLLAAVVALGTLASITAPSSGAGLRSADLTGCVLALLTGLPLTVRRRWPLAALVLIAVAAAALQALHYIPPPAGPQGASIGMALVAVAVAVFRTTLGGARQGDHRLLTGIVIAATATECVLEPAHAVAAAIFVDLLLVAAWALGCLVRARRTLVTQALARVASAEREKAANARAVAVEERARIAGELHDIVAHNVSLMVVQSIAAGRVLHRDHDKAHELHTMIERTGRATLDELRRILDVLPTDDAASALRLPQPRLKELPRLLTAAADAGLDVAYATTGAPRSLPDGTDLTAYRIVEEALTNTLRHAGPTRTMLTVGWDPERLTITVSDDGPRPGGNSTGPIHEGHGLLGMRERVTAVGGELHTGPRPEGGFLVRARLPAPSTEEGYTW